MGQRGPIPKPTAIKKLEGNPSNYPLNDDDLLVEAELPAAPPTLTPGAKKVWTRLGAQLLKYGLVSGLDEAAFAILCESYSNYLILIKDARVEGTIITVRGQPQANPLLTRADKEADKVLKLLREFGLSPSARARLNLARPDADPDDKFGL